MRQPVRITVNGRELEADADTRKLLVNLLRDDLELTGTHFGCGTGTCGACTVMLNGRCVKSCCVLAVDADGAELLTIEGVANDAPHPVQQALAECHGVQCGFCTPGMVLSAIELLQDNPAPSDAEIREALAGNLCRCTGYVNIVAAVQLAATRMAQGDA
ncbi:MAG: (2Fe-2S)-binding protein [Gammaproteobacteria bacterium]|nr:(2Fe-2S)-binding protein [Gammaproteobacteria bacterium]MYH16797.1 (2Fe-2S)-binding protein [Gammaproteobacteria bacterium]MYK81728.1 (2Fe-2S)-binding protein [Gammaproteobacteria bacterium]